MVADPTSQGDFGVLSMDLLSNLQLAFSVIFQPENLLFCFVGCLIGTLIGVLPGLGPVATISLLLPSTFHITPVSAIIMLAGIPRVKRGMKAPWLAELLADSGLATPSMAPVPNFSGCLDTFFSTA